MSLLLKLEPTIWPTLLILIGPPPLKQSSRRWRQCGIHTVKLYETRYTRVIGIVTDYFARIIYGDWGRIGSHKWPYTFRCCIESPDRRRARSLRLPEITLAAVPIHLAIIAAPSMHRSAAGKCRSPNRVDPSFSKHENRQIVYSRRRECAT